MSMLPKCRHRKREVSPGRFICTTNHLIHRNGICSADTCMICPYVNRKNRRFQFGDWAAKAIKRIGFKVKPGCGCHARQWKMNRIGERIARLISTFRH